MTAFSKISQEVTLPAALQSTANINAGATWSSGWVSTLNVAAIQPNLYATENCIVYVDQGSDGANADAGTDPRKVYAGLAHATGWTVGATSAYVQIRVQNTGLAATTALVLETALLPIGNQLPRSLSSEGNLKTGIYEIEDERFGKRAWITPMSAIKVTESFRLVGSTLSEAVSANFWTSTLVGSGTSTVTGGQTVLATGTTSGSSVVQRSARVARYMGGSSNVFRAQVQRPATVGANVQRWGAYSSTDGCFFEADNVLGFAVVTRKGGVDTRVATGTFNGDMGVSYVVGTVVVTYEIVWTNGKVYFLVNDELLHVVTASSAPWANTVNLPVAFENVNGANVNDNTLDVRVATISRLGHVASQPQYLHINTNATFLFKTGPGLIHSLIIGTLPTAGDWTVSVYDNTSAVAASLIGVFVVRGIAGSARVPCPIDLQDVPYNVGLTIVTAGSAGDLTLIAE